MIINPYLDALSGEIRAAYFECVSAIKDGRDKVPFQLGEELTRAKLRTLGQAVFLGNPDCLLTPNVRYENGCFCFEFIASGSELRKQAEEVEREVERISAIILRDCHTDLEKLERLNAYLCRRIGTENVETRNNGSAYGALIERKARCEGVSKAAALIADRVGLDVMIVAGKADSGGGSFDHAWNIIAVGGDYYHFDFGWNAATTLKMVQGVIYLFNSDDMMLLDHHEDPSISFPRCSKENLLFSARHRGEIYYAYQAEDVDVIELKTDSFALLRFHFPIDEDEIDGFITSSLCPYSHGDYYQHYFDEKRNMLQVYFLHKE
ncbi:MAG: transglutaminase domain-containing protein [Bacilli bacterium]|nr:transglutaminase domain-containing protein [Bacilli bacterium]